MKKNLEDLQYKCSEERNYYEQQIKEKNTSIKTLTNQISSMEIEHKKALDKERTTLEKVTGDLQYYKSLPLLRNNDKEKIEKQIN